MINFRSLLLKADFRIFYFEFETLLNKLVTLCSYFLQKNNFEQKCRVFYFHQKINLCDENISDQKFKEIHPNYVVK